jgi:hypothetical protein
VGLLKNAHLLRYAANRASQRISVYASRFGFLRALYLNIRVPFRAFEQPPNMEFLNDPLSLGFYQCLPLNNLHHFPGNNNPLHLRRTLINGSDTGVTVKSFDFIFFHIAVSTVNLQRLISYSVDHFGGKKFRH